MLAGTCVLARVDLWPQMLLGELAGGGVLNRR
jgi:hypothetical protein